jgi:murein DD-endopeptidase MepM/ murein hydrolase activator NlpD
MIRLIVVALGAAVTLGGCRGCTCSPGSDRTGHGSGVSTARGASSEAAPTAEPGSEAGLGCPNATYPLQETSPYVLPYPVGVRHNVRQGNCNDSNTHNARTGESYAYDFEMPIGSDIVAARGGRVILVIERFGDEDHGLHQANGIFIEHADGTYAKYGHLTHDGALVGVGQIVQPGELIGKSGNSGLSRAPHLHFSVRRCPEGRPTSNAACISIPVTFRNTRPHPHGLVGSPTSAIGGGEEYEALPYDTSALEM